MGKKPAFVERVRFLIGHHHTYGGIDGTDYRILVEAGFLVNLFEDGLEEPQVWAILRKYFRTAAGKRYPEPDVPEGITSLLPANSSSD